MKFLPTLVTLLTVAVLLTAATASLGDGVPAAVHYINADKVAATMVKGGLIVNDPGLTVQAGRRGAGQQVEYHDHTNHIFILVEGEATVLAGGTMVDATRTAPDQMRAAGLEGAETYHLTKGDVLTIPAKTPHWFKEVPTKTIAYYAVNIESQ
jgi:mannose-6-phosphate isomerase-like protein (cupin superfamily)